MILLEHVSIREFRGIRELDLDLGAEPFVIYGPNGSGKSAVVDAIEFAITGDISRLQGKGTAGISVGRHGPHVLRRDDPEAAKVTLRVRLTDIDRAVTLTRNAKRPDDVLVEPNEPAVRQRPCMPCNDRNFCLKSSRQ